MRAYEIAYEIVEPCSLKVVLFYMKTKIRYQRLKGKRDFAVITGVYIINFLFIVFVVVLLCFVCCGGCFLFLAAISARARSSNHTVLIKTAIRVG